MNKKYYHKFLVLSLALLIAVPVAMASVDSDRDGEDDDDENSTDATFTLTSLSTTSFTNNADTLVFITGTGFSTIGEVDAWLGEWDDDSRDQTDDRVDLNAVAALNDTTLGFVIPAGTKALDDMDVTVADLSNDTHVTLRDVLAGEGSVDIDDNEDGVTYSSSAKSKTSMTVTLDGRTIENKAWIKARIGTRPVKIKRVSRANGDTTIEMELRHGKLAVGSYDLRVTYKDQVVKPVIKKGKAQYKKTNQRGTITQTGAFEVVAQQ